MAHTHLEIIYHNNQYDGVRTIKNLVSQITAYIIPYYLKEEAQKILKTKTHGLLFLFQNGSDNQTKQTFVGQSQDGISTLHNPIHAEISWNTAIFFETNHFFKIDLINQLQSYIIQRVSNTKHIDSYNNPQNQTQEIDNITLAQVESIYEEIKFIMSSQGYHLHNTKKNIKQHSDMVSIPNSGDKTYQQMQKDDLNYNNSLPTFELHLLREDIAAKANFLGKEMVILSGSQISSRRKSSANSNLEKLLDNLVKQGDIKKVDGKLILMKNKSFNTPSAAAAFIARRSAQGPLVWKDFNGNSLGDYYKNIQIAPNYLEPNSIPNSAPYPNSVPYPNSAPIILTFHTKNKNFKAVMNWEGVNKFIVKKGSEIAPRQDSCPEPAKLRYKNASIEHSYNKGILQKDEMFESVSAAANFVLGRSANGNIEWLDTEADIEFKEFINIGDYDNHVEFIRSLSQKEINEDICKNKTNKNTYNIGDTIHLFLYANTLEAEGKYETNTNKFTILKGAKVKFLKTFNGINTSLYQTHQRDLKEGVIIFDENDETYKLNTDKVFSTPEKATTYISGNDEDIHLDMWYDEQETPLNEIINCIQKLNS